MSRLPIALCVLLLTIVALPMSAATLSGTFDYAGQSVSSVFPSYTHGRAMAYNTTTSEWVYGTIDPLTGTYQISNLTSGPWFIRLLVGAEDFGNRGLLLADELTDFVSIQVGSETTISQDFALRYAYRITEPFSDFWPGSVTECPYGPVAPDQFTFSWEAVPLAIRYEVIVNRRSCSNWLESDTIPTDQTSVQIQQGTAAGEEYLKLKVYAYTGGGLQIASQGYLDYENGASEGAFIHSEGGGGGGGGGGRTSHPADSLFVPQVARLPGVSPSFWTSDVVLTNPAGTAVTATLIYTPRDVNGLTNFLAEEVAIPAGGCRVLTDVVGSTFSTTGAGSLQVSPSSLLVTSRISTPGQAGGTYGQGFPAMPVEAAASLSGPVTTLRVGGLSRGEFRSNLVLTEVWGESAGVKVTVLNRQGTVLGTRNKSLQPFGTSQLNDVVSWVGGPSNLSEGQVKVEVTSGQGRVVSVLSLVDSVSQDPTTLVVQPL